MKLARFQIVYNCNGMSGKDKPGWNDPEARRMRWLRAAEGYPDAQAVFARKIGMSATQLSNFERGDRRVPRDAALRILQRVPGFDLIWLWTGDKRGLSHDLRRRIEAVMEAEMAEQEQADSPATSRNAS